MLPKSNDRYHNRSGKEKTTKCYIGKKQGLKESARKKYRNLSKQEKELKKEYIKNIYRNITENENNKLKQY